MNSQRVNQIYKAALVLNNRGIQFVEMQSYHNAIIAFNDALKFIKACYNDDTITTTSDEVDEQSMNKALNDTSLQLSQLKQEQQKQLQEQHPSSSRIRKNAVVVVVVTEERSINMELVTTAMKTISSISCTSKKVCIRIDDMDGHCDIDDSNLQIESAIIIYNLATAYHSYSSKYITKHKRTKAIEIINHAHSLYNVAMSILSEVADGATFNNDSSSDDNQNDAEYTIETEQLVRVILFKMIVLHGLLQVSMLNSCVDEGRKYYCILGDCHTLLSTSDVLQYFQEQQDDEILPIVEYLPAPAA